MRSRKRILLAIGLAVAIAVTVGFGTRAVVRAVYWSQHREEPIQPWMTVGYVANSYGVPTRDLQVALGLPEGVRDRRPLAEIARDTGRSEADLKAALEAAIGAARAGPGVDPPP